MNRRLTSRVEPSPFGDPRDDPHGVYRLAGKIDGKVVSISELGVAITDISTDRLVNVPIDESVSISCDGHRTIRLFHPQHNEPELTLLAILGKSGFLEIGLVGENIERFLGIRSGSRVIVEW